MSTTTSAHNVMAEESTDTPGVHQEESFDSVESGSVGSIPPTPDPGDEEPKPFTLRSRPLVIWSRPTNPPQSRLTRRYCYP